MVKVPDPPQPDMTPLIVQVPETVFMLLIDPCNVSTLFAVVVMPIMSMDPDCVSVL